MTTTNRLSFLARVSTAIRSGNVHREHSPREIPAGAGYVGAGDDPIGRFIEEATKVGARVERTSAVEAAHDSIRRLIERFAVRQVIRGGGAIIDELRVDDVLRELGVRVIAPAELAGLDEVRRRDACFAADLGIAAPDWAIAETGSLVYAAGPEQTRSATLLPPVNLAILDVARIVPDLFDLPARLVERATDRVLPRNVAIVTGPSKTGDIELKLTTGVHGPGEVYVLVWERSRVAR